MPCPECLGAVMRRRDFIKVIGGVTATWPVAAWAQQPSMPVVGVLASAAPFDPDNLSDFRKALTDAGYADGKTVAIEVRAAERYDQLPAMAADLVRRRVAVIVAAALPAGRRCRWGAVQSGESEYGAEARRPE